VCFRLTEATESRATLAAHFVSAPSTTLSQAIGCFNVFKIGFKDPVQLNIPAGSQRGIRYWPQALSTVKKKQPFESKGC
jgi:hypothetical protein